MDEQRLRDVSHRLMREYVLTARGKAFWIEEGEFYLRSEAHPDLHAQANAEELTEHDTFYFMRVNGTGRYVEGSFKGVNLTFAEQGEHAGFLVRSLRDVETNELTEGPCLCAHVMMGPDFDRMDAFVEHFTAENHNPTRSFAGCPDILGIVPAGEAVGSLTPRTEEDAPFHHSVRVGLRVRGDSADSVFASLRDWRLPYRVTTCPRDLKKQATTLRCTLDPDKERAPLMAAGILESPPSWRSVLGICRSKRADDLRKLVFWPLPHTVSPAAAGDTAAAATVGSTSAAGSAAGTNEKDSNCDDDGDRGES